MTYCTGQGDNGDHCCYIDGKVCQFLDTSDTIPRCGIWDSIGNTAWQEAPVGQAFARLWPGYTCHDWPQNIPEVMAREPRQGPFYACCWGRGNRI